MTVKHEKTPSVMYITGWSWKGLVALVLGIAAVAGVLAGVGAALTVLLLARRREAAGQADKQQLLTAAEAESTESTSTQVGRETAEQFAPADSEAPKVCQV